ncbi:hypothetical protein PUR71_07570 [Streptomyces sp. SP17BM10]|uniref:hypothetical protein n=1 Tax=Streptomyces sp. SP17BM10 TaxID=3002530 RepID=UPI002E75BB05|nr:hypothetical protein [Streptomyces sp. SP17BM10]MEE1782774.1 hypothetical protein [Streptomyces sp. SP17BM10]
MEVDMTLTVSVRMSDDPAPDAVCAVFNAVSSTFRTGTAYPTQVSSYPTGENRTDALRVDPDSPISSQLADLAPVGTPAVLVTIHDDDDNREHEQLIAEALAVSFHVDHRGRTYEGTQLAVETDRRPD